MEGRHSINILLGMGLIFWVAGTNVGFSQPVGSGFTYETWTQEDGLPTNGISNVVSTGDGYMLLTTFDGLVRFNGIVNSYRELFTTLNKSNTQGFSTNRLTGIYVVDKGEYFLSTERISGSQNIIYYKDGVFESYGVEEGMTGDNLGTMVDENGNFWVLNDAKLFSFENQKFKRHYPNIDFSQVTGIHISHENDIWYLTDNRLVHLRNGIEYPKGRNEGLGSDTVFFMSKMGETVWVSTEKGFNGIREDSVLTILVPEHILLKRTHTIYEDLFNPERVFFQLEDESIYVYYRGEFQLIPNTLIDPETNTLRDFELLGVSSDVEQGWQNIGPYLFHDGRVVFQTVSEMAKFRDDQNGGFWVVDDRTLYRFTKATFSEFNLQNDGLANIYPVIEDSEETIWVANLTGQVYRKERNKPFTRFDQNFPEIDIDRIYSILEDDKGHIWFGSTFGVLVWDRKSAPVSLDTPFERANGNAEIRAIFQDQSGILWFGSEQGIYSLNEEEVWKQHPIQDTEIIPGIRLIFQDNEGVLWFGTNGNGLLYKDPSTDEIRKFEDNNKLSDTIIRSFYQDPEGIYWAGMEGGGLNRIEKVNNENQITHYNSEVGLFGSVIHSLLEDEEGRLWMSCNQGIFWVSKEELNDFAKGKVSQISSTIYDETDGLPGNEANGGMQSTGLVTSQGEFWFPMVEGIAVVKPDQISNSNYNLVTRIEALTAGDSTFTDFTPTLKLRKEQRNLQFNYVGYDYNVKPDNVQFRYKLEGYDPDWILVGSRKEAFYTSVPAGQYTFLVEASVAGGDWVESESGLTFSISPYFRETNIFVLLIVLTVFGIGFLFYKWRVRSLEIRERILSEKVDEQTHQLREQAERLQELDKAKSRFFANVSHEFRTPLTLTIGPLEDIRKGFAEAKYEWVTQKANLALRNSKRLLRLINQILDVAKVESGNMQVKACKQDFNNFVHSLCLAFVGLSERKKITYKTELPDSPIPLYFDVDMMEKIVVNLISNAFKFTPQQGKISIQVGESDEQVTFIVSDTGYGISEKEQEHIFDRFYQTGESRHSVQAGTGIGLSLTKELVELHGGLIHVESKEGEGTSFTVTFKKGKNHFGEDQIVADENDRSSIEEPTELAMELQDVVPNTNGIPEKEEAVNTKVLVIDDNAEIRAYIRDYIKEEYQVLEANNGETGLKIAQRELPDMVICDVMMPKMDGYEFTEQLKKSEETDFIPVILLTAKAEQKDKLQGLGLGADDYIVKPFDIAEVKARLLNLIQSRKILKARFSNRVFELNAGEVEVDSADSLFLKGVQEVIEKNLDNEDFTIEEFVREMAISRASLFSKLKELTGKTPSEILWDIRLEHAAQLLQQKAGNVSEVAYSVGYKSIAHFSRSFKKKYSTSPGAYSK